MLYFAKFGEFADVFAFTDTFYTIFEENLSYCGLKSSGIAIYNLCYLTPEKCEFDQLLANTSKNVFKLI